MDNVITSLLVRLWRVPILIPCSLFSIQKTCMAGIQPCERGEFIDKKQVSFHKKNSFRKAKGG